VTTWPRKTIAECAAKVPYATQIGPFGKALTPEAYRPTGIPLLRGVNVNHGRFHDDDFVFIGEEDADRLAKFESFPGDVLLVHKGTLGQIGLMPHRRRFARYIMGNSMLRVRCDPDILLPEYLYYWLSSADGKNYLLSRVSQVGVPQIQQPLTTLREATLPVPSVSEQRAITSVLGSLDDKIEQNRRTARALERLARAIFRAWFVDFEPVKAKAAGAASFPSMPQAIFDALPTTFTDSDLGPVPEGWEVKTIDSVCDSISSGGTPARMNKDYWEGGTIPWFKTGELFDAPLIGSEEQITDAALANSSCKLWPAGTILFALYASPTVGRMGVLTRPGTSNQAAAGLIVKPEYGVPFLLNSLFLARGKLQQIAVGAAQQNINQGVLKTHKVIVPNAGLALTFSQLMTPALEMQAQLTAQSATLASLRDYLLSQLLSGQVPVEVQNA
jgi:type I restriction enzyme S subunit